MFHKKHILSSVLNIYVQPPDELIKYTGMTHSSTNIYIIITDDNHTYVATIKIEKCLEEISSWIKYLKLNLRGIMLVGKGKYFEELAATVQFP